MKKTLKLFLTAALLSSLGSFPSLAGQWVQDTGRPAAADGVSNWRWREDDGNYVRGCDLWLDGDQNGVYEHYYFNSDGWMLADTKTLYDESLNIDGAALSDDGTVQIRTAPKDICTIAAQDYVLALPDDWKNHFSYSMRNGNLYVDFHPMKYVAIDGEIRSSVSETMFWILRFDSREEMEQTEALGMHDGWMYLGSRGGAHYVSCGPTDTALEFFTDEERALIQQMRSSLMASSRISLWGRMTFYQ